MPSFLNIDSLLFAFALFGVAVATARLSRGVIGPSTPAKAPAVFYETLEGLRGVLAVLVFIHHANTTAHWLETGNWDAPPNRFLSQFGQPVVSVFFMLTAFLFWDRVLQDRGRIEWWRFFVARVMRLVPVYLLAIGLVTLMAFAVSDWVIRESLGDLVKHVSTWTAFTIAGRPDINGVAETWRMTAGVTWSLRFEWIFYLALPLMGVLAARTKQYVAGAVSLAAITLYLVYGRFTLAADGMKFVPFFGGLIAAYWIRSPRLALIGKAWYSGALSWIAVLLLLFVAPRGFHPITLSLLTAIFVVAACDNTWLSVLRGPNLCFLGKISYSVYLLHGFCLWCVFRHVGRMEASSPWVMLMLAGVSCAMVIICSLTYRLVEEPGLRLGRRMTAVKKIPI